MAYAVLQLLAANFEVSPQQGAILTGLIVCSSVFLLIDVKDDPTLDWIYDLILIFALCFYMAMVFDFFNGMYVNAPELGAHFSRAVALISALILFFIYVFFIGVTGNLRITTIVVTLVLMVLAYLSFLVLSFRGSRFSFSDLFALSAAFEVSGNYNLIQFTDEYYLALFMLFLTFPLLFLLKKVVFYKKVRLRLLLYLFSVYGCFLLYSSNFDSLYYTWLESDNSYFFYLLANEKMTHVAPPSGYNEESVAQMIEDADDTFVTGFDPSKEIAEKFPEYVEMTGTTDPNIIVIMNESLTDLSVISPIPIDVFSGIHGLSNTIQGDLYTEVYGGGTADTEYTYLTSNSTIMLPENTRPYQFLVDEETTSLVSDLHALGYDCFGVHPGLHQSWNREEVYEKLGFDRTFFEEWFEETDYVRVPELKSDWSTYERAIERLSEGAPSLIFDVTIQNHGSYEVPPYDNLEKADVTPEDGFTNEIIQFLSLMQNSDQAFTDLVHFLEDYPEPTLVLMFGDHQPTFISGWLENQFDEPLEDLEIEEAQKLQITPYVFWANYTLPDVKFGDVSINYLKSITMELAGLEPTPYDHYLASLYHELPVINSKGIITRDGHYYTYSNLPPKEEALLEDYEKVLYYQMY